MSRDNFLEDPKLRKAAVVFAAGYAKRIMERHYSDLLKTGPGDVVLRLDRPTKYAIEAALNGIAAYLSTKQPDGANSPIADLIWELARDAPSEISRRILNSNGNGHFGAPQSIGPNETKREEAILQCLLNMEPQHLRVILSWLETADPRERHLMAETIAQLTEDQRSRFADLSETERKTLFEASAVPPSSGAEPKATRSDNPSSKSLAATITENLRSINERLEQRKPNT